MSRLAIHRPVRLGLPAARRAALSALCRAHQRRVLTHIGPIAAMLLVLCAALWALGEYAQHRTALRAAETQRYIEQFQTDPVAGAWARLMEAWRATATRRETLLERLAVQSGPPLASSLQRYRALELETVAEHDLADDVRLVLDYFKRLALCIRMESCDRTTVAAWFGDRPWRFRDRHYLYLKETFPGEDVDAHIQTIAPRPKPVLAWQEDAG